MHPEPEVHSWGPAPSLNLAMGGTHFQVSVKVDKDFMEYYWLVRKWLYRLTL